MITLEEACAAYHRHEHECAAAQGREPYLIDSITETEACWVFYPAVCDPAYGCMMPVVDKATGSLSREDMFDYGDAIDISVPEEFRRCWA